MANIWNRPSSDRALELLQQTIDEMKKQYGQWDTAWGEIHKVGRGGRYFPVGGAEFRSGNKEANFSETLFDVRCDPDPDQPGRFVAHNGSMAMILMFFHKDGIESLTCTPWGQSGHSESAHYLDQGEKPVFSTQAQTHLVEAEGPWRKPEIEPRC